MQTTEPEITVNTAQQFGLTAEEFDKIIKLLDRIPNLAELRIFSVVWSEKCFHSDNVKWRKTLTGERNTGPVDIGNGWGCILKINIHSLENSSEIRDNRLELIAMGARPIFAVNALSFGNADLKETKHFLNDALKNFAEQSEDAGLPIIASEVNFFEKCGDKILLHTLSAGILKPGEKLPETPGIQGSPVFIVNFKEKKLAEAIREAVRSGAVAGMQPLGPDCLAVAALKMCENLKTGMVLHLDEAAAGTEVTPPVELLFSDKQGLLVAVNPGKEEVLQGVFEKWELESVKIGEIAGKETLAFFHQNQKLAEIPPKALRIAAGAPSQNREVTKPAYLNKIAKFNLKHVKPQKDLKAAAEKLLTSPNLAFRTSPCLSLGIFKSESGEFSGETSDAALVGVNEAAGKSLAVAMHGHPFSTYADPYSGSMIAVAEASRKIICTGAVPAALAVSLNFGHSQNPEVFYQFAGVEKGLNDACRKFDLPVVDYQVHFEKTSKTDDPSGVGCLAPVVGILGMLEHPENRLTLDFKAEGDAIYMLGNSYNDLGSSEYLRFVHGIPVSPPPVFDLHEEFELQKLVKKLHRKHFLRSAHSISAGGLFTALLESAIVCGLGFNVETVETFRKDCFLFGESQSRVLVTVGQDAEDEFQNYLINNNVSFTKLGEVFGTEVIIDEENFGSVTTWQRIGEKAPTQNLNR